MTTRFSISRLYAYYLIVICCNLIFQHDQLSIALVIPNFILNQHRRYHSSPSSARSMVAFSDEHVHPQQINEDHTAIQNQCNTKAPTIPYLTEDNSHWNINHFLTPLHYRSYLDYVLIPHGVILDRIDKLVEDIANDYPENEEITLVCVLKGASIFFHEFLQAFMRIQTRRKITITYDFIKVKSYNGMQSTGVVEISGAAQHQRDWRDKHVLFVEDIVDTGLTMSRLAEYMQADVKPSTMKVATLLQKRLSHGESRYQADYVGFSIPDVFVVGYGLDYNEALRDMSHVCVLNDAGIAAFAK